MKPGRAATSLNLPTLLSFNELAWVAVSAMALFCGFLLSQDPDDKGERLQPQLVAPNNEVIVWKVAYEKASNDLAQATAGLADTTSRLALARRDLAELQGRLIRAESDARSFSNRLAHSEEEAAKLRRELSEAERGRTNRTSQLVSATSVNAQLQVQLQEATERAAELERKLAEASARLAERPSEGNIRKELLGLRGALSNVVILLDRSSSMAEGRRWEDSLWVIEAWLEYLPIENCALITFSTECQLFPADGSYLAVGGTKDAAREVRRRLLRQVRALRPEGNTATVEALRRAYEYPQVDTIILFTDGEPLDLRGAADRRRTGLIVREWELTATERRKIAKAQIQEALVLARNHPDIPINVVALADYFADWKADFLLSLARYTGGAFLGR